jgi:hypothetical protein
MRKQKTEDHKEILPWAATRKEYQDKRTGYNENRKRQSKKRCYADVKTKVKDRLIALFAELQLFEKTI